MNKTRNMPVPLQYHSVPNVWIILDTAIVTGELEILLPIMISEFYLPIAIKKEDKTKIRQKYDDCDLIYFTRNRTVLIKLALQAIDQNWRCYGFVAHLWS